MNGLESGMTSAWVATRTVLSTAEYNRSVSRTTASSHWSELRSYIEGESYGSALSASRSLDLISGWQARAKSVHVVEVEVI